MFDKPINDQEMAKALALIAICDAAMEEQVTMNLHPPIPRSGMMRIVAAILDEMRKQNVKLAPPTAIVPRATPQEFQEIIDAMMAEQKDAIPQFHDRINRRQMMRLANTSLVTRAIQQERPGDGVQKNTGVTYIVKDAMEAAKVAQRIAVTEWIGAAIVLMNFAAGQGFVYHPDDTKPVNHDHPAQPDVAMMRLWQAFGEPEEFANEERSNELLIKAVTGFLGR